MAYKNNITNEIGTIFKLLPDVSNPHFLSEQELLDRNIIKYNPEVVEVVKTLDEVKTRKLLEIKSTMSEILNEGYITPSKQIKVDIRPSDMANWVSNQVLMDKAGLIETTVRDYDNVSHVVTAAEYTVMAMEIGAKVTGVYNTKWQLQNSVNDATTISEVDAIYWRRPIYDNETELNIIGYDYFDEEPEDNSQAGNF